jgi:hypothetical protein
MSLTKASYSMITGAPVNVVDLGADPTGVSDSYAAFAAAWNAVKNQGGDLYIPPGDYLLNSQWVCDIVSFKNIKITGYGATLFAGASVTRFAVKISGSLNETILDIQGLSFNHRGNTTVGGCFNLVGAHCVHITSCNAEFHNTKAGYAFAQLEPSIAGNDDTNSFWCTIEKCTTRKRSGLDGTNGDYGVILIGSCNSTKIQENQFSNVKTGVYITHETVSTSYALANACVIQNNDFETLDNEAISVVAKPGYLGITGLRVLANRTERTPTFFSFQTGGAAALQHAMPPFLMANFCTTGSVTNWIFNPTNYAITTFEAVYPGFAPAVENTVYMNAGMKFVFPTDSGFTTANASGSATYDVGFLTQGVYRYWTNPGDGKFYVKSGVPTSATDGTVVGTQT